MRMLPLAMGFLIAGAVAAAAHAMLEHATPAAGATLAKAPLVLILQFSEALEPAFSSVSVTDESDRSVATGPPLVNGTTMRVPLKPLTSGTYRASWHAVSVDTHRTEGAYDFRIAP